MPSHIGPHTKKSLDQMSVIELKAHVWDLHANLQALEALKQQVAEEIALTNGMIEALKIPYASTVQPPQPGA